MDDNQRHIKNLAIKEKGVETRNRHKAMLCRVIMLKVVFNKLNKTQKEELFGQFREAKWIYNNMLSRSQNGEDIFKMTDKDYVTVDHLDKDRNVLTDEIKYLSRREVQSVISGIKTNISNLAKAKAKGQDVGALRFITEYTSIDLAQYEKSYRIVGKNKVKVDKVKKPLRVRGLEQLYKLDERYEMANAKLIKRPDGFYIGLTVYIDKIKADVRTDKPLIGLDMGCETSLTFSNGVKINAQVKETERLKRLQCSLDRCKKGSHNRWKIRRMLRKEYQHISNKRDDMAKKLVHQFSTYRVVMQDEQLSSWQSEGHGAKVEHGVLGRVKSLLMKKPDTFVINKWVPTTKLCTECGCKVELTERDRTFICPVCGHREDRDVHAAKNMLWFHSKKETLCVERIEYNHDKFVDGLAVIFNTVSHETTQSSVEW